MNRMTIWMRIRMVTRAMTIAAALALTLLLALACRPIQPPEQATAPTASYSPTGCAANPQQRIITGLTRDIRSRLSPRLNDFLFLGFRPGSESEPVELWVRAQYIIQFPTYRGILNSDELRVMLVEGPGVTQLDEVFPPDGDGPVANTPNHYIYLLEGGGQSPGYSPFGSSPAAAINANKADFEGQWALTRTRQTTMFKNYPGTDGSGVIVGVFDSSPFQYIDRIMPFTETQRLTVTVNKSELPVVMTSAMTLTDHYSPVSGSGIDHGVFVAGLLNQIAPKAEVHLYRTFNEAGLTDGYTLAAQFHQFYLDEMEPIRPTISGTTYPKRFVANMSFSLSCPPGVSADDDAFQKEVRTVIDHIHSLLDEGVVVVAAAGNTMTNTTTKPTLFPASLERVISVGALNYHGRPACYSHNAEVYLPAGGDFAAMPGEKQNEADSCKPAYDQCVAPDGSTIPREQGECPYGVLSLSTTSPTGLAFWSGTSFATPLVSALVALRLDDTIINTSTAPITITLPHSNPSYDYEVINVGSVKDDLIRDSLIK